MTHFFCKFGLNFVIAASYTTIGVSIIFMNCTPQFKNYVATLFFNFLAEKAEFGRVYKPKNKSLEEYKGAPEARFLIFSPELEQDL